MSAALRDFLHYIEENEPKELVRIHAPIDPNMFEANAIYKKLNDLGKWPALLFENPKDLTGARSEYNLLVGVTANQRKAEIALGLKPGSRADLVNEYLKRESRTIKPVVVDKAEAPVKEVVMTGDAVNLAKMPVVRQHEMDGNPYFDTAVVAWDEEYGYNTSFQRMMYLDENHTAFHAAPRHLWTYLQKWESAGRALPMAIIIGHHPSFYMGALTLAPIDTDEYEVIGGVMKEPLRLVPSEAYGDRLLVPADAEVIVEGELLPNVRTMEGPFAEFTDYYGPQRLRWVFEVKAVTHRRNPIFMTHISGDQYQEDYYIDIGKEAGVLRVVRNAAPSAVAVAMLGRGLAYNVVISMKKRMEGEPMRAALAALGSRDHVKHVIVVDHDIDPWNLKEVMWAIAMRVQAGKDVTILRNLKGSPLDPSADHELATDGMIIDATIPLNRPFEPVTNIPKKVLDRVNLEEYVNPDYLKAL
ncbi:MAG: UbiD family decarboxylase [Chloroflexi bacterium]|nr:UbiD family decarboxylase [Chloroflexota bacterium]